MYPTLTQSEAVDLIRSLKLIFDIARLVDVSLMIQYNVGEGDEILPEEHKCHAVWNKSARCENCISSKAFAAKGRMTKYEFVGDDIYYVVAKYIVVGDKEYILEIVSKVTDELLFGAFGKENIIKTILRHNDKIYKDPLTGAYNRHYYEEQLQGLRGYPAVAMLDIDNFKKINDTYGHHAGDAALRGVVDLIKKIICSNDVIIRYGGDEFLIVFHGMDMLSFKNKLEEIRGMIATLKLPEYPDMKITVSIGGYYISDSGVNAIQAADTMLYRAKRRRNAVCCCDVNITDNDEATE